MPRIMPGRFAALMALVATTMLLLVPYANADINSGKTQKSATQSGAGPLLEEIYASRKPVRFERIDVSGTVAQYIPLKSEKSSVLETFGTSPTSKIVENSPDRIVIRDDKGRALLDPDARSIVMTFFLDADGRVIKIDAVHIKSQ